MQGRERNFPTHFINNHTMTSSALPKSITKILTAINKS